MTKLTLKTFLYESAPTPSNVNASFTVGKVLFDNANGLGATPMGQNVFYRGAVAWIKPSTFRALAHSGDRSDDATKIAEKIRGGQSIAVPFLDLTLTFDDDGAVKRVKVSGHEGRARSDAFALVNGNVYMPVQLHPSQLRARDLCEKFFEFIEDRGIVSEGGSSTVYPDADRYFWNGQEFKK